MKYRTQRLNRQTNNLRLTQNLKKHGPICNLIIKGGKIFVSRFYEFIIINLQQKETGNEHASGKIICNW